MANEELDLKRLLAKSPTSNRGFSVELKDSINKRISEKRTSRHLPLQLVPIFNALIAVILVGGVVQYAHRSLVDHAPSTTTVASSPSAQGASDPVYVAIDNWYHVGSLNVMVTKQTFSQALAAGSAQVSASDGRHWLSFNVTMKNVSATPITLTSKLFDLDYNDVYDNYTQLKYPVSERGNAQVSNSILGHVLEPGQVVKGVVVFEVPSSIWWDVAFHVTDNTNPDVLFLAVG